MNREADTQYVLSISYGKDSLACLGAIEKLGLPLDRIVHAGVWATQDIPADLPQMVEFKQKADEIIKQRYGIEVEHVFAKDKNGEKLSYEDFFYKVPKNRKDKKYDGKPFGFPMRSKPWCNTHIKVNALRDYAADVAKQQGLNIVQYLGIAADEPERIKRHTRPGVILPLVEIGWDEADCRKWCEENDLLSPIYTTATRGGCWFCHNQSVEQLRLLRWNHPELWELLLKWDNDSPVTFKADGHTVRDFDKRFRFEDRGLVRRDAKFKWADVAELEHQISFFA